MSLLRYSAIALLAAAGAAHAAPAADPPAAPAAQPAAWSTAAKPVKDTELDALSGGQSVATISEQQLKAMNSGNEVNAQTVTNGAASVNLSGFSGLGNFVVNTGNNNNLQGTMSVSITLAPSP